VLGGLAEFERHLILTRTAEGRTRAMANALDASQPLRLTNALKPYADALMAKP